MSISSATEMTSPKSIGTDHILVLDFGGQYAQLIARRVREQQVFCEIVRHDISPQRLVERSPRGIILSGGPSSVYDADAPVCDNRIFELDIPVLGICYGMQLACGALGGAVENTPTREFGRANCTVADTTDPIFNQFPAETQVWMSHGDQVTGAPQNFVTLASTPTCPMAAVKHVSKPIYGLQFHPEVTHTPAGSVLLRNFVKEVCGCSGDWNMKHFADQTIESIRAQVGDARVICGLSGGVDSAVTAALIARAVGDRLTCILVDHGLMRKNETDAVVSAFSNHFNADLITVHAESEFLSALDGVEEPQEKRRRIGHAFIECFRSEASKVAGARFLAQGTLYPDVIESGAAPDGPAATIKLHHNVGGLPEELGFELVEPLRELFKDEVRKLGEELGLPEEIVWRHPFPGPGLAVRCLGPVCKERLDTLREADAIVVEEVKNSGFYRATAQAFAVLLPIQSVGVMGDARTYENALVVRCVDSDDFMTADWSRLPHEVLARISTRIINEVRGVNRVVYDISSKPPATIEWE